jgi:hypothetical protein
LSSEVGHELAAIATDYTHRIDIAVRDHEHALLVRSPGPLLIEQLSVSLTNSDSDVESPSWHRDALRGELGFWTPPTPAMTAPGYGQDYKPIPNLVCTKP